MAIFKRRYMFQTIILGIQPLVFGDVIIEKFQASGSTISGYGAGIFFSPKAILPIPIVSLGKVQWKRSLKPTVRPWNYAEIAPKRKTILFQPSIFRCLQAVSLREGVKNYIPPNKIPVKRLIRLPPRWRQGTSLSSDKK